MTDSEGSMKRVASEEEMNDEGMGQKRQRSGGRAVDVRFLLQSKNAGAIIGKGGSNINRLRKEYKASVTVPDCPGPERILSLVADVDTVGEILMDIIPKLDEYAHHRTLSFDCELRMLLHQSHAGCLIGRGGSRIKELRDKTGAQIKVYTNCCPNSTERVVLICGFPKVAVDSVKEICDIISQAPIKGPNKLYDPHHFNPFFASEYGGFEDGPQRGGGGPRGRGGFRGRVSPPAWRDEPVDNFSFERGPMHDGSNRGRGMPPPFMGRGRGGGPGGRWTVPESSMDRQQSGGMDRQVWRDNSNRNDFGSNRSFGNVASRNQMGSDGMRQMNVMDMGESGMQGNRNTLLAGGGGGGGGMGNFQGSPGLNGHMGSSPSLMGNPPNRGFGSQGTGGGDYFASKSSFDVSSNPTKVKIPNDVAGAIIGKGGMRIRKIRRDSNAGITIEEATPGSNERVITITGTPQQVQMAQYLLQQSVREHFGRF